MNDYHLGNFYVSTTNELLKQAAIRKVLHLKFLPQKAFEHCFNICQVKCSASLLISYYIPR